MSRIFLTVMGLLVLAGGARAHKVNPPVHQHIAVEALKMLPAGALRTELETHLGLVGAYDPEDTTDGRLLEGVFDEDATSAFLPGSLTPDSPVCVGGRDARFWRHGWDPDGGYQDGFFDCTSTVWTAHLYWLNVIDEYKNGHLDRAYWWLGRVVHLLEDNSVPAHSHADSHLLDPVFDDNYEEFMVRDSLLWPPTGDRCITSGGFCNYQNYLYDEVADLYSPPDGPGEPTAPVDYRGILFNQGQHDSWLATYAGDSEIPETALFRLFLSLAETADEYESDDRPGEAVDHPGTFGEVGNEHLLWHARELMKAAFEHVAGLYSLFWDSVSTGVLLPLAPTLEQGRWNTITVTVAALEAGEYEVHVIGEDGSSAPRWIWANTTAGPLSLAVGQEGLVRFDLFPDSSADTVRFELHRRSSHGLLQRVERLTAVLTAGPPDVVPPTVVDHSPSAGGNLPPTSAVRVEFSETMETASLLRSRVSLVGSINGSYDKIVFYDPETRSATIRPAADLVTGETVTVTLSPQITDLSGNGLDGDGDGSPGPAYSFTFNVSAAGELDPPSSLSAVAGSGPRVDLNWLDRSSAEGGFRIQRRFPGGAWAQLASVTAGTTGYTDTTVSADASYEYRVQAFNASGASPFSDPAAVTITGAGALTAPSSLSAVAASSSQINLAWERTSSNESGFKIERSVGGGPWLQIATAAAGTTFYADRGLISATTYTYRVRAYNGSGNSGYSNLALATTGRDRPDPPSDLRAWAVSDTHIALSWRDRASNEDRFEIERRTGVAGSWSVTGFTGRDDTTFEDFVSPDTEYSYRVRAYNAAGFSDYSNTASAVSCVAPFEPRLESPYDGEDDLPTALDLEWDTDDEVSIYDVYFGPQDPPPLHDSVPPDLASSSTRLHVSGLEEGRVYYWRVVAHAACNPGTISSSRVHTFVTLGAPGPVQLLRPTDGTVDVPTGVVLDWANVTSDGPTLYELDFGTETPPPFFEDMGTRTEKLMTGLMPSTTYFWKVIARSAANPALSSESPVWSFTTGGAVVETVTLDAVQDAGLRGGGFGGRNYGGNPNGAAQDKAFGSGNDDNFYLDPGSAPLRGAVEFSFASIPDGVTVTNATLTLNFAGSTGSQTSPLAVHFDPYQSTWSEATVTWNNRPSRDLGHRVVGTFPLSGFNPLQNNLTELVQKWLDGTVSNHGIEISIPEWEGETHRAKYFYQKEWSPSLAAELQVTYRLPCEPPPIPVTPSPADGAGGQPPVVVLDWEDVAGASAYDVRVGTSQPPPSHSLATGSTLTVTGLQSATTYFWQIESLADCDPTVTSLSPVWSFTTDTCFPPPTPALLAPVHQAVGQPKQVTLEWGAASDAATYEVYVDTLNPPTSLFTATSASSVTMPTVPGTTYFWRVRTVAACDPALATDSDVRVFSTALAPQADAGADRTVAVAEPTVLGASPSATGGLAPYTHDWSVEPSGGVSLEPVAAANPTFTADSPGVYTARLVVTDANGFSSPASEVVIHVPAPAQISVSPVGVDFGYLGLGTTTERTFEVRNLGDEILSGEVSVSPPFHVAAGSPYLVAGGGAVSVTVAFSPTVPGLADAPAIFTGGGGASRPLQGFGVEDLIFADGFESGDTSIWSSSAQLLLLPGGEAAEMEVEAALDSLPQGLAAGERREVMAGFSADGELLFTIVLQRDHKRDLLLAAAAGGEEAWRAAGPMPIPDSASRLRVLWRRAYGPGYDDGLLTVEADGSLVLWLDRLSNGYRAIHLLRYAKELKLEMSPQALEPLGSSSLP